MELNKIYNVDCIEGMRLIDDNSVDAIVTDPPYEIGFMGRKWDNTGIAYNVDMWKECLRILKPGGYLLSFAGTRTQHKIASAIEDAGFEIRDIISWVYSTGFPKSLNIGKVVDKMQGNEREIVGTNQTVPDIRANNYSNSVGKERLKTNITKGTSEWEGFGTSLKPAFEPITVARKPISENTIAENCLKWGTGGINIDECRVGNDLIKCSNDINSLQKWKELDGRKHKELINQDPTFNKGRFPANFIHDGSDEVLELFPDTTGQGHWSKTKVKGFGDFGGGKSEYFGVGEKDKLGGSAARFFYCAKASSLERNNGFDKLEDKKQKLNNLNDGDRLSLQGSVEGVSKNNHPTVKPVELMTYLIKLVSRENSIIVDPFTGSGTTLVAAKHLKRNFIGFEKEKEYCDIANKRLKYNYTNVEREKVGLPNKTKGFF